MRSVNPADRRQAPRRTINRMAKIQLGNGALPRDCLITDISTGGVRLHVEGYEVPDDFVLLLCGDDLAKECNIRSCGGLVTRSARNSLVLSAGQE